MVALLGTVHTGHHIKGSALVQLGNQVRAGAEVQIAVGKGTTGGGIHLDGNVDIVLVPDSGGCLNLEHRINGICPLLGHKQLAADILLVKGGGGVADRGRNRHNLPLRNLGDDQLQLTGIVGALGVQVAFQDTHRHTAALGTEGQGEMVALLSIVHTGYHVKGAALIQLGNQVRAGAEVQIAVGKGPTGGGIHLDGDIDVVLIPDGGGCLDFEHRINGIRTLLGYEQLAADILLVKGGGGVADGSGRRLLPGFRNFRRNDKVKLFGCKDSLHGHVVTQGAHRNPGAELPGGEGKVVGLPGSLLVRRALHGGRRFSAGYQIHQVGQLAHVQIGIGETTLAGGYIQCDINHVLHPKGGGFLYGEGGIGCFLLLFGQVQLAGDVLLLEGGCGKDRRNRLNGILLGDIRQSGIGGRHERNHQLPLLHLIAPLAIGISRNQAHRHPGIVPGAGGEVEQGFSIVVHALYHREGAALAQPVFQLRLGAQVQIGIGAADPQGDIQRTAAAHGGGGIDQEIPAQFIRPGVDHIQAVHRILFNRCGIEQHRLRIGNFRFLRLGFIGRLLRLGLLSGLHRIGLLGGLLRLGRLGGCLRRLRFGGHLRLGCLGGLLRGRLGGGNFRLLRLGSRSRWRCLGLRGGLRGYLTGWLCCGRVRLCPGGQDVAHQHGSCQQKCKHSCP